VNEREFVACALSGAAGESVHVGAREFDFFDAKASLETLMENLGIADWTLGDPAGAPFHPARSAGVMIGGLSAGTVGEIHPRVAGQLDLTARVAAFELEVGVLAPFAGKPRPFRDIPRFPPVRRDLAFLVDDDVPAGAVGDAIREAGGGLVDTVVLFDVFQGGSLPKGKKSLAFSVDFRAADRTLTDAEAERAVAAIVARLASDFGAELRTA
jgi:phenylalanyl-tRNA synthetase beta chain